METEEKVIIGIIALIILVIIIFGAMVYIDSLPKPPPEASYVVIR
jgi:hypothetical protein